MSADDLTDEERRAIAALERLAKRWPQTLMLLSYDGALSVVHVADYGAISDVTSRRSDLILADIEGIPNDGGAW